MDATVHAHIAYQKTKKFILKAAGLLEYNIETYALKIIDGKAVQSLYINLNWYKKTKQ